MKYSSRSLGSLYLSCVLAAFALLWSGCDSCAGCGDADDEPEVDTATADTFEPDPDREDPLAGAADEAKEKAVSIAVRRADEARFVSSDIRAARNEQGTSSSGPETIPARPEGSISAEKLQQVFRERSGATQQCYERQLKKNPSLAGRVILRLTIGSDGSVLRVNVRGATLQDEQVNSCIEGRVRGWKFPKPDGGAARVRKPITFNPKN